MASWFDGCTAADEARRLRVVAQFVRLQQRRQRLRQPGEVLGDVDESDGEVAGGVEDGEPQRAGQDDVAGGYGAVLP